MIAFLRSCSPPSIFLVSPASTCADRSSSARPRSSATGSPASAHSSSTVRSSSRLRSDSPRSRSSSSRRRRCSSFCAAAWSFQKSASPTRSSMVFSSSAGCAASKIAPQVAGAARQILDTCEAVRPTGKPNLKLLLCGFRLLHAAFRLKAEATPTPAATGPSGIAHCTGPRRRQKRGHGQGQRQPRHHVADAAVDRARRDESEIGDQQLPA